MNIFVLDTDVNKCAEYHCDKHVIKMILEYAQMLSTTVRITSGEEHGYKITHTNHPCTKWVRESLSNWKWLRSLSEQLNNQYRMRYEKSVNHKSYDVIQSLPIPKIEDKGLTPFPLAMPEHCKMESVVDSYRNYYNTEKQHFITWKNMKKPDWVNI